MVVRCVVGLMYKVEADPPVKVTKEAKEASKADERARKQSERDKAKVSSKTSHLV
jgi:hypothetical protein